METCLRWRVNRSFASECRSHDQSGYISNSMDRHSGSRILPLFLLCSCTLSNSITIRPDGSAFVTTFNDPTTARLEYYTSSVISEVDTAQPLQVSFVINELDSLGTYLPWLQQEALEFRYFPDSVVVRSLVGPPGRACGKGWTHAYANLFVEQGISGIRPVNKRITRDGKWVAIRRSKRKAKKEPFSVTIDLVTSRR